MNSVRALAPENVPRLIPIFKQSERSLLSVFMAALDIVPEYRAAFLERCNYGSGRTCQYKSCMEPVFRESPQINSRPDGYIICQRGQKIWSALIEAKANKSPIRPEQIKNYCALAHSLNIPAVITISNEFSKTPEELFYHLAPRDRKKREVFHFSWAELRTFTELFLNQTEGLTDQDRNILKQVSLFFWDRDSGITTYDAMPTQWPEFVVSAGTALGFHSQTPGVSDIIHGWQQEKRDLCAKLIYETGLKIDIRHDAGARASKDKRFKFDRKNLSDNKQLTANYVFKSCGTIVQLLADLSARKLTVAIGFTPPSDRKARGSVNWMAQLLKEGNFMQDKILFRWGGHNGDMVLPVPDFLAFSQRAYKGRKEAPKCLLLMRDVHDVRQFKSRTKFIEMLERTTLSLVQNALEIGIIRPSHSLLNFKR